ncbi:hypothetical protein P7K49_002471 [Saguinus oedipus]|uniref:Uncharacterized protein n=1 Tax=Saguinus oedipus TaxID=9490 RepID=A0ABQ9WHE8_SAGOE|nr:hypothetical protein P7K49_002471 [Saguinus oedipus]
MAIRPTCSGEAQAPKNSLTLAGGEGQSLAEVPTAGSGRGLDHSRRHRQDGTGRGERPQQHQILPLTGVGRGIFPSFNSESLQCWLHLTPGVQRLERDWNSDPGLRALPSPFYSTNLLEGEPEVPGSLGKEKPLWLPQIPRPIKV